MRKKFRNVSQMSLTISQKIWPYISDTVSHPLFTNALLFVHKMCNRKWFWLPFFWESWHGLPNWLTEPTQQHKPPAANERTKYRQRNQGKEKESEKKMEGLDWNWISFTFATLPQNLTQTHVWWMGAAWRTKEEARTNWFTIYARLSAMHNAQYNIQIHTKRNVWNHKRIETCTFALKHMRIVHIIIMPDIRFAIVVCRQHNHVDCITLYR